MNSPTPRPGLSRRRRFEAARGRRCGGRQSAPARITTWGRIVTWQRSCPTVRPMVLVGLALGAAAMTFPLLLIFGAAPWWTFLLVSVLPAASCGVAARRSAGVIRLGWAVAAIVGPLWGAAVSVQHAGPYSGLSPMPFRVLAYVAATAAVLSSPGARRPVREWTLLLLDGWMVGVGGFVIAWLACASTLLPRANLVEQRIGAWLLADWLLLSVVVGLAHRTEKTQRLQVMLAAASYGCALGSDLLGVVAGVDGGQWLRAPADVLSLVILLLLAAMPWTGRLSAFALSRRNAGAPGLLQLPFVVATVAVLMIGWTGTEDRVLLCLAASLVAAALTQLSRLQKDHRALSASLAAQARRVELLLDGSHDAILQCDLDGTVRFASNGLGRITGHWLRAPRRLDQLLGIPEADFARAWEAVQAMLANAGGFTTVTFTYVHADGGDRRAEASIGRHVDEHLQVGLIITLRDTTDRWRLQAELSRRATTDSLTGLANRDAFVTELGRRLRNPSHTTQAVLFLDLDGFKDVNDSLGHPAGDDLLRAVAARVACSVRPTDLLARLGGDEFAAAVGDADRDGVLRLGRRLLHALRQPITLAGRDLALDCSIGVAFAAEGDSVDQLVRDADLAMYRAKAAGGGRVEVFQPRMLADVVHRVDIEERLRRALREDCFEVHYQPIVTLADGRARYVEALVRWRQPDGSLLRPGAFIGIAEDCGLVVPLDRLVLRRALAQSAAWEAAGLAVQVSVNLSPRQLAEPGIVDDVMSAVAEHDVDTDRLTLEITENVLVDSQESRERLVELRAHGVRIALDDFGAGYSGLNYLRTLPVDQLKLDRSYISGLGIDHERSVFVRALLCLGSDLGLTVVAEGVETEEQFRILLDLGCQYGQGFLFARPGAAAGVVSVLSQGLRQVTPSF